jgi:hypothetical protein
MPIHLLDARKVAAELAAGTVSARDQATYLAAAVVIALAPYYLLLIPAQSSEGATWVWLMWSYEGLSVIGLEIAGIFYCLQRCGVEPHRHFVIDFSCLSVPIALTTTAAGWALFYLVMKGLLGPILGVYTPDGPPDSLTILFSPKLWDVVRYVTMIGIIVVIFARTGSHLERVSSVRRSA